MLRNGVMGGCRGKIEERDRDRDLMGVFRNGVKRLLRVCLGIYFRIMLGILREGEDDCEL